MKELIANAVSHEYLGFCEEKGYIYSVQTSLGTHRIIAVKNQGVDTLLIYSAPVQEEEKDNE